MALNGILRRASSFLGISPGDSNKITYEDGDIVFCKNNVCVHPPSRHRGDGTNIHHPGYLVIKCQEDSSDGNKTLILTWIPNDRLKRNHELISQLNMDGSSGRNSPYPISDAETISVSSLVLNDSTLITSRKVSDDEQGTLSTSGVSSLDTTSLNSHGQAKDKSSPNSDTTGSDREDTGIHNTDTSPSDHGDEVLSKEKASAITVSSQDDEGLGEDMRVSSLNNSSIESLKGDECVLQENSQQYVEEPHTFHEDDNDEINIDEEEDDDDGRGEEETYPLEGPIMGPTAAGFTNKGSTASQSLRYKSSSESSQEEDQQHDNQHGAPQRAQHYFQNNNGDAAWFERSAESMAYSANLAFPETSLGSTLCLTPVDGGSSPVRRLHNCGIFNNDLRQNKSLRMFFSDHEKTCGQLVIASRESQYKIFHFHHGGLDRLASIFHELDFLLKPREDQAPMTDSPFKQFMVCRPVVSECELHPEDGKYGSLDADTWVTYFSQDGMIEDDLTLRRTIFFGGVEPQLRANVWPFLLHYYDYRTTFVQRQQIMEDKHQLYKRITDVRDNMTGSERDWFMRSIQCTVEKDVVRTDRSNPCFAGNDNPNLEKMKNILLNFATHNPILGYTQGMSDILAPILAEVRNEADVFWCFAGLMSKTIFITSPKDEDMEKNLNYLCELLRLMAPHFYDHMASQQDGLDLLFCHRWILLCFKREFPVNETLAMWEACWSNYQTDYFHLFLVVAIVSIYGKDVVDQKLRPDETLLYFTSLANHMDGHLVLKKGRGLLHQFRSAANIPCTLVGLCELCGPGMWDSGHVPVVACTGHSEEQVCPIDQMNAANEVTDARANFSSGITSSHETTSTTTTAKQMDSTPPPSSSSSSS